MNPPMALGVKVEIKVETTMKAAPMYMVHFWPKRSEMGAETKKPGKPQLLLPSKFALWQFTCDHPSNGISGIYGANYFWRLHRVLGRPMVGR